MLEAKRNNVWLGWADSAWLAPSLSVWCLFKHGFQAYRAIQHLKSPTQSLSLHLTLSLSVTFLYIIQSTWLVEQGWVCDWKGHLLNSAASKRKSVFPMWWVSEVNSYWQELNATWDVSGDDRGISMWCYVVQIENEAHTESWICSAHVLLVYTGLSRLPISIPFRISHFSRQNTEKKYKKEKNLYVFVDALKALAFYIKKALFKTR